jgi:hypothetical protein
MRARGSQFLPANRRLALIVKIIYRDSAAGKLRVGAVTRRRLLLALGGR